MTIMCVRFFLYYCLICSGKKHMQHDNHLGRSFIFVCMHQKSHFIPHAASLCHALLFKVIFWGISSFIDWKSVELAATATGPAASVWYMGARSSCYQTPYLHLFYTITQPTLLSHKHTLWH